MSRGRLRSIKVGKRRLVPHDDLKHWLRTRPPA
jgi:excisionase family DNA binding protein